MNLIFQDKIQLGQHANDLRKTAREKGNMSKDGFFFPRISKSLITQLYEEVYKVDFKMFAYPYPQQYIEMGT